MLLLEHPPVYTRRAPLGAGRPAVRRGVLPRARDRRRADAARRPAHLPRPGQLVGYPIMRVAACPSTSSRWSGRSSPRSASRRGGRARASAATSTSACGWATARSPRSACTSPTACRRTASPSTSTTTSTPFSWVVACGLPEVTMTSMARRGRRRGHRLLPQARGAPLQRGVRAPPAARQRRAARHRAARRGMNVGLAIFLTGDGIRPDELARAAETRGFESLFLTEHTHIPARRAWSARDGGPLDDKYRRTHDPFVALAFAAAATTKLVIGTSVCLVIEHDPIVLAKAGRLAATCSRAGASCSASARAGTRRRCATTAPTRRRATARCASASRRCRRSGATTRPSTTASTWTSTRSGSGRSRCSGTVAGLRRRQRPARRGPRAALRRRLDAQHAGPRRAARRGWRRCASAPGAHVPVTYYGAKPENLGRCEEMGVDRALIVLESGSGAEVLRLDTLTRSERRAGPADPPDALPRQPRRDGRHEGAGRGRAAVPRPQAAVVQGPAARAARSTAS